MTREKILEYLKLETERIEGLLPATADTQTGQFYRGQICFINHLISIIETDTFNIEIEAIKTIIEMRAKYE